MDDLQGYIRKLSGDGRVDSRGEFSLDPSAARKKLARFQLHDPEVYSLFLLRFLLSGGAQQLEVRVDSDDFEVRYRSSNMGQTPWETEWPFRYWTWGLQACKVLQVSWIRFRHRGQSWEFPQAQIEGVEPTTCDTSDFGYLHVRRALGKSVVKRFLGLEGLTDVNLVKQHFYGLVPPIQLNGQSVCPDPAEPTWLAYYRHGDITPWACDTLVDIGDRLPSPPGPVELLLRMPWLSDQAEVPQPKECDDISLDVTLGGGWQEQLWLSANPIFHLQLSIEGTDLDLSLRRIAQSSEDWKSWERWLKSVKGPLLSWLCDFAVSSANRRAQLYLLRLADHLHPTNRSRAAPSSNFSVDEYRSEGTNRKVSHTKSLYQGLRAMPLVHTITGDVYCVDQLISWTPPLVVLPDGIAVPAGITTSRCLDGCPSQADILERLGVPVKRIPPPPEPSSKQMLEWFHQSLMLPLSAPDKSSGDLGINLASQNLILQGTPVKYRDWDELALFSMKQYGDTKTHHYVLLRLRKGSKAWMIGDRGKDYNEYDAEIAREFSRFREGLKSLDKIVRKLGGRVIDIKDT